MKNRLSTVFSGVCNPGIRIPLLVLVATLMTGHGTADIILTAIGDTSVSGTDATHSARGLAESVHLSNNSGANRHKGYFLFDLSDQMALPGFADTEATFTVHFLGTGSGIGTNEAYRFYGLNAGFDNITNSNDGTTNWNEETLVSSNAPANATANTFDEDETTFIIQSAALLYAYEGPLSFTVPRIGDYLQADGTATFMMAGITSGDRNFFVGSVQNPDSSLHPSLIVIPEPSTLLLVGVAGIAGFLALRRRRR